MDEFEISIKKLLLLLKTTEMKDVIEIKKGKITARLSVTVKKLDSSYIGYIPSFDIPFTSPSEEKVSEIAKGLINVLFKRWLEKGKIDFFKEKLEKHKFSPHDRFHQVRFEHSTPSKSIQFKEELYVV
ncbi:hypothetical protein [Flavobacterium lipolyticum]|uniref:Uncharacterized protein n=1 Tax=Flavobacterium lipolyticum TaxID=2893754 RepID=A0ABS8M1H0_9FLAO|nr:hypothetical protein [Flavobacterium sp. F-126]MCC9018678.1 hypothetical protein [Flavobacterium sp. F-126]